ncbi:MAG: sensor histidine kinase [Bacteroidetes bacterium]|nr:sensor histidine kinase [Bacteroidota bacterium]
MPETWFSFFQIAAGTWSFWFWSLLCLLAGLSIAGMLWRRREGKVLNGLRLLVARESDNGSDTNEKSTLPDLGDALDTLLQARKEELQRLNMLENYRRDYIGNVAHELKTPIFNIQGYIETIQDDPDMDAGMLRSFLDKAARNTERLAQIVGDLDTITKYESGFLQLEYEAFDLRELVQEVIENLEVQASAKKIHISDAALSGDFTVWADKFRIRQVLTNLGTNSIKYGKEGGSTRFKLSDARGKVIVEVSDNGIGIPQAHLNRIFERFYRVEKSRNRESGGSGLGLSICKHIIEAHGEQIQVLSTEGAGSVFSFSLRKPDKP